MLRITADFFCSEWSFTVKAVLIVIVSVVLLAVIALLVSEAVGKRDISAVTPPQVDAEKQNLQCDRTADTDVSDEPGPEPVIAPQVPEDISDAESAASKNEIELRDAAELEDDGNTESGTMIYGDTRIKVRYDRSFAAMLIQSDDTLKGYYSELRNEIDRCRFKQRMSWSNESFYKGRKTFAKFAIRGKTLSLYIALEPIAYENSKYTFKNVGETAKYRDVPMQLKIRSDRAVRWAKELIAALAEKSGTQLAELPKKNYRPDYKDTKSLVREKLIKLQCVASPGRSEQELEQAAVASLKQQDKAPRDFSTKLMRADSLTKARYSAVKNELLRYGMKPRMSTSYESWYIGRTTYAKFAIRGKTLTLYMALDPKEFEGTKYNFRNMSTVGKYETVPMRVNLKSDRAERWVKELIATLAEKKGWQRAELGEEDFRYVKKKRKKSK